LVEEGIMTLAQWAEPALLWGNQLPVNRKTPQLLELTSDDFLPEFLTAMKASPDKKNSSNPVAEDFFNKWQMKNPNPNFTLYQPLHSRYYLVTASLVCHQAGLPDKEVNLKKGEKTYFVLRRMRGNMEQGWSDTCGWFNIADGKPCEVPSKEEQFPAHPVSVCTGKDGNVLSCERKIYYGYIATGNREKYLDKQLVKTTSSPESQIKKFFEDANKEDNKKRPADKQVPVDYRFDIFDTKVIASWKFLIDNKDQQKVSKETIQEASFNVLLDLRDTLERVLPTVWGVIQANNGNTFSATDSRTDQSHELYEQLNKNIVRDEAPYSLLTALREMEDFLPLLQGQDIPDSPHKYNVSGYTSLESLKTAFNDALAEENQPVNIDPANDERARLIENQARPIPVAGVVDTYFVRMAYEYDPECPPIYSIESTPFTFARNLEPDAPARLIRIEMPSIKPRDLRKFRHGVGMQMSPELRKVMDGVHKDMLKGEGLNDVAGWELGMICTFSIQIITLIAFVVMFIFAILLNIVFWWMAFLKICLPIPKKA